MSRPFLLKGKGVFFSDEFPYGTRVCTTLAEATVYAIGHPLAYVGQLVVVTDTNRVYVIASDKSLVSVGGSQTAGVTSFNGQTGAIVFDKTHLGLSNVDNTSDLAKPVSTAQQAAIRALLTSTAPVPLNTTAASGSADTAARADHIHPLPNASLIPYGNSTIGSVLDQLMYVAPSASLSGGGTYEYGRTITSVVLNWTLNKEIVSQSLNNGIGSLATSLRTFTHAEQAITANRTYTLTASDGTNNANASTTVAFSYKRYWGVSANPTLTDADILAMSSEFAGSRTQNRTFDCSGGKYFYTIWPAAWGNGSFTVGGLAFSDLNRVDRNMVNGSGATVPVTIARCNIVQYGSAINVAVT